jgi:hypothetical protein
MTLFTTELHPTAAGHDFRTVEQMIAWRESQ